MCHPAWLYQSATAWYGQMDLPGDENTFPNNPSSSRREDLYNYSEAGHSGSRARQKYGKINIKIHASDMKLCSWAWLVSQIGVEGSSCASRQTQQMCYLGGLPRAWLLVAPVAAKQEHPKAPQLQGLLVSTAGPCRKCRP